MPLMYLSNKSFLMQLKRDRREMIAEVWEFPLQTIDLICSNESEPLLLTCY